MSPELSDRRDDTEPLPNPARGCGHLERGKAYLVGAGFSEDGVLPAWVELDPPLPFREIGTEGEFTRGFQRIDGLTAQLALEETGDFVEHYPDELFDADREDLVREARENHVEAGVYNSIRRVPKTQSQRHIDRIRHRGVELAQHWGEFQHGEQTDLLMRAGESYYSTPAEYAHETTRHGLSKAISITPNRDAPTVVPGVTRCWIMHPAACEGFGGGIIGFAYLSEVAFTEPEDGEVPAYVEESSRVTVRDIEAPAEPIEADEDQMSVADFEEELTEESEA